VKAPSEPAKGGITSSLSSHCKWAISRHIWRLLLTRRFVAQWRRSPLLSENSFDPMSRATHQRNMTPLPQVIEANIRGNRRRQSYEPRDRGVSKEGQRSVEEVMIGLRESQYAARLS